MREGCCYLTRSPLLATMTAGTEEAEALRNTKLRCRRLSSCLLLEALFVGLLRRKKTARTAGAGFRVSASSSGERSLLLLGTLGTFAKLP
jgi:hypothetical protein